VASEASIASYLLLPLRLPAASCHGAHGASRGLADGVHGLADQVRSRPSSDQAAATRIALPREDSALYGMCIVRISLADLRDPGELKPAAAARRRSAAVLLYERDSEDLLRLQTARNTRRQASMQSPASTGTPGL